MKLLYKTILLVLLLPTITLANDTNPKWKHNKEKTIKKEFNVNKDAGLRVDNSYGNIDIITWSENRTVIEVTIKASGNDEEAVQEKLEMTTVEFTANGSLVTAKTKFGEKSGTSWNLWGKKNSISIEVNYKIKLPVTNTVDLDNSYGSISINKLEGNAKINCDYGQLIIGELLAENNYINFDYTDKSTIRYMKSGKIDADYSAFTLDETERLELVADYTQSQILKVGDLNFNCDYGKISIGDSGDILGRGDYLNTSIGAVSGNLNLNTDYGSVKVDKLLKSAKNVTISSDYTGVKLGIENGYNFDFAMTLSYADLSGKDLVTITNSDKGYTNKKYLGYHGSKNSGNKMNINSSYGGITLTKN
ncbi:hypothetical protein ACFQO1_06560 [Jejudonia soesokkakensis]|uniref:Adhesin domain-containing protein n=1 Tax=Jejudonia soesokkakensis TaxID=1323432 RepID=A0ABW2MUJ1_9FLAO